MSAFSKLKISTEIKTSAKAYGRSYNREKVVRRLESYMTYWVRWGKRTEDHGSECRKDTAGSHDRSGHASGCSLRRGRKVRKMPGMVSWTRGRRARGSGMSDPGGQRPLGSNRRICRSNSCADWRIWKKDGDSSVGNCAADSPCAAKGTAGTFRMGAAAEGIRDSSS